MVNPSQAVKHPTAANSGHCFPGSQVDMSLVGCVRTNPTKTSFMQDTINRNTSLPADLSVGFFPTLICGDFLI